jgi:hypothetical protein
MPRTKGAKNRQRQTPNPQIELHKTNKVTDLDTFCRAISPKNAEQTKAILQAIKDGKLVIGQTGEQVGVAYHNIRAIIARLQDIGILTRDYTFSEGFQNKLTDLSVFYGTFSNKQSRLHQGVLTANKLLKDYNIRVTLGLTDRNNLQQFFKELANEAVT